MDDLVPDHTLADPAIALRLGIWNCFSVADWLAIGDLRVPRWVHHRRVKLGIEGVWSTSTESRQRWGEDVDGIY